jgi:hypothetical protein
METNKYTVAIHTARIKIVQELKTKSYLVSSAQVQSLQPLTMTLFKTSPVINNKRKLQIKKD